MKKNSSNNYVMSIIIFCQAPAHVQYALDIYEKQRLKYNISIYCINVEGMFKYIDSLNLSLEKLIFIPYDVSFRMSNLASILDERKRLNNLYLEYFKLKKKSTIYFFSKTEDWITSFFIRKLSSYNQVFLVSNTSQTPREKSNNIKIKEYLSIIILKLVTKIKFNLIGTQEYRMICFPIDKYNNIKIIDDYMIDSNIFSKYQYKSLKTRTKNVLLFDSDLSNYPYFNNYNEDMRYVLSIFKKYGYEIYVKAHPRLGKTKNIDLFIDEEIPLHISGEFIDVGQFDYVISVLSLTITNLAKNNDNIYTIAQCFNFINIEEENKTINYLVENSNSKIKFINNIEKELSKKNK